MVKSYEIPEHNPNPQVFEPVGQCIYCGEQSGQLTNEHIIPRSLDGLLILPKSSCRRCAAITATHEGAVARSLMGNFRIKHKLPTRRKKQRPKSINVRFKDKPGDIDVPISDYPAPAFLYKCNQAGILQGLPKFADISGQWQIVAIQDDEDMNKFQKKYGKDALFEFRHVPEQFAKTIAKIGYSYAVANMGAGVFTPLITDLILNKESNLSYYVGGKFEIDPPVKGAGHLLSLVITGDEQRLLIIVEIRLFASCHTPSYHTVVGEVTGGENVKKIIDRYEQQGIQTRI